jgi:hypothetical protein
MMNNGKKTILAKLPTNYMKETNQFLNLDKSFLSFLGKILIN